MTIGQNLHFNMARVFYVFFKVDAAVLEGVLRLLAGTDQACLQAQVVVRNPHAFTTTARGRLDQYRVAHFLGQTQGIFFLRDQTFRAGDNRHLGLHGHFACLVLVAQSAHRLFGRTYELDVARAANFGEVSILGKKAVAGVNGLNIANFSG